MCIRERERRGREIQEDTGLSGFNLPRLMCVVNDATCLQGPLIQGPVASAGLGHTQQAKVGSDLERRPAEVQSEDCLARETQKSSFYYNQL